MAAAKRRESLFCLQFFLFLLAFLLHPHHQLPVEARRDRSTSSLPLIPRGANYIRLNGSQGMPPNLNPVYHSTFSPLFYNASESQEALDSMSALGYNSVRVFIDTGDQFRTDGINGDMSSGVFNSEYLDNLGQFLGFARVAEIYVMPTLPFLPYNSYFNNLVSHTNPNITGVNSYYLDPAFVNAKSTYVSLFVSELKRRVPLDYILGISLENEACYDLSALPFSSLELVVQTADGNFYDMSQPSSRQQAADANMIFWADTILNAVSKVDPDVRITVGMFTFQAVGKTGPNGLMPQPGVTDPRYPFRPTVLEQFSKLSYLDVHIYPTGNPKSWTLEADLQSDEWTNMTFSIPVVMGEYGGFTSVFDTVEDAASYFDEMLRLSCKYNFVGWLYWTWDTWEQPFIYYMTQQHDVLADALAPSTSPNICS